jgi:L-gulonolactone oxidase
MRRFVNWARTASCNPAAFARPTSEEELRAVLHEARGQGLRVKAVGAGHSFSDAACTDGVLVSLDALARLLAVESDRVTVEAGIRLDALNDALAQRKLALGVVGSIARQRAWPAPSPPARMAAARATAASPAWFAACG